MYTKYKAIARFMALLFGGIVLGSIVFVSCQKTIGPGDGDTGSGSYIPPNKARLEVRLTDKPNLSLSAVWVDVREIQVLMQDSGTLVLAGSRPGMYDLMQLTNGRDTLLSNALIPPGRISQIRLILGDNNFAVLTSGDTVDLKTPSAQQSGLKVLVNDSVSGGMMYTLTLDFDASRSVIKAGNSGQYILKPVLRVISFAQSGGNARGVVLPDSVLTAIFAIRGIDTIASTFSDTAMGGAYTFLNIPAGNYIFSYEPQDTIHLPATRNVVINLGITTIVDTVRLQ